MNHRRTFVPLRDQLYLRRLDAVTPRWRARTVAFRNHVQAMRWAVIRLITALRGKPPYLPSAPSRETLELFYARRMRRLLAACMTVESAHQHEDLLTAQAMLDQEGVTYAQAIAELQDANVLPKEIFW